MNLFVNALYRCNIVRVMTLGLHGVYDKESHFIFGMQELVCHNEGVGVQWHRLTQHQKYIREAEPQYLSLTLNSIHTVLRQQHIELEKAQENTCIAT